MPAMAAIAVYGLCVAYLEIEFWKLSDTSHLKNISVMHNMLGVVISLLLVFRTNTAYDRWWEGRRLWGELVNTSRNLAARLDAFLPGGKERDFFRNVIPLFAAVLRAHLQGDKADRETVRVLGIAAKADDHLPNAVARALFDRIHRLYKTRRLTGEQLLLLGPDLAAFGNICGACERIRNTPIPYSYSAFIKKFIFFYTITMPLGHAFTLGYYMVPVVTFIFYVLASLELIAEEIEDPFGKDPNDLPLARLIHTIEQNVADLLR